MSSSTRAYEATHPWIDFNLDTRRFSPKTWLLLGEAASKCDHIAGAPLSPNVAEELMKIYISKGAHGTTSIEGNTLTEREVRERIDGQLELPISREYQGREIDNVVDSLNVVVDQTFGDSELPVMSSATLKEYHKRLFVDQPLKEGVVPGEFRTHSVHVAGYLGAPAEDCEYLMGKLFEWLEADFWDEDPVLQKPLGIVRAIMAHLYIAWIHPFGDGNGRMARLVEFRYLVEARLPLPACHALSDHYNRTRDSYYASLAATSAHVSHPVEKFIDYAVQGFVDELKDQLAQVRSYQMEVAWRNYVHDVFRNQDTPAKRRQRHIALDLPWNGATSLERVRNLSDRVADGYSGKSTKTVTRDLNALSKLGLVEITGRTIRPRREIMAAFLAPRM